jgi:hypothetical protein
MVAGARLHRRSRSARAARGQGFWCGLTFELTGPRRQDALARAEIMYRVPQLGPRWPAVAGPVERGVRQHCAAVEPWLRGRGRTPKSCCGAAVLPAPRGRRRWVVSLSRREWGVYLLLRGMRRPAQVIQIERIPRRAACRAGRAGPAHSSVHGAWAVARAIGSLAVRPESFRLGQLRYGLSLRLLALPPRGCWRTPKALTLLVHYTASVVLPNVRANRPAEAGSVSLVRDDAPCASDQAYAACRSGSG